MADKNDSVYLYSNALLFATKVCQSIQDMVDKGFAVHAESLKIRPFSTDFRTLAFISFVGKITGHYVIAIDETTAFKLTDCYAPDLPADEKKEHRHTSSGALKEILNVAVGHAIIELEKLFGTLVYFPPTIVYGEVEFPAIVSADLEIAGEDGVIQCACCLNLSNLKIGRKLEEAQKKLMRVSETQNSMLLQPEELPNARFCVVYKSLDEAGGDLYDVFKISDDVYAYFIGDVAGHDIGTGFITASIRALLRQNCTEEYSPLESMRIVNNVLCDLFPSFEYVTACYVVLYRKRGFLSVINMGHPPMLFLPAQGEPELISSEGDVLGAFKEGTFQSIERNTSPGDRIVIYTDGLVEGKGKLMWAQEAGSLLTIAPRLRNIPLKTVADALYHLMYHDNSQPTDDVVIMGIEV
jgi:serine phosphatase RsbU (regulator of sigma subunit)